MYIHIHTNTTDSCICKHTDIHICMCVCIYIHTYMHPSHILCVQGTENALNALSCRPIIANEQLTIELFCGKVTYKNKASYASAPPCSDNTLFIALYIHKYTCAHIHIYTHTYTHTYRMEDFFIALQSPAFSSRSYSA